MGSASGVELAPSAAASKSELNPDSDSIDFQDFYQSYSERLLESVERDTKIVLIRHGETEWNVLHRYQGQMDSELTEKGKESATKVGRKLYAMHRSSKRERIRSRRALFEREGSLSMSDLVSQQNEIHAGDFCFDAVYASPLGRVRSTVELALSQFSDEAREEIGEVTYDDRLKERNLGVLEGKVKSELAGLYSADVLAQLLGSNDVHFKPEGENAESIAMVRQRMNEFVSEIMSKHRGQTILVFAHGGVISSLISQTLIDEIAPDKHYRAFFIKNCAINVLAYINEEDKWYVDRLGDDDFSLVGPSSMDDSSDDSDDDTDEEGEGFSTDKITVSDVYQQLKYHDRMGYLLAGFALGILLSKQLTRRNNPE